MASRSRPLPSSATCVAPRPASASSPSSSAPWRASARPTLRRVGQTAVTGKGALDRSLPFMDSLRRTLQGAQPIIPTTRDLASSLVERGGTEGLLRFFYNAALATSRYDGISHILPAHLVAGCVRGLPRR